mmetsp:Transcript_26277/g.30122  ORF Transcript_26277/g.30122 Transcript_26277/m.30122 type:complete len:124 (-) Transcript_26277:159-530(-)
MSEVYTKPVHGSCLDKQQEVGCSQLEVPTFSENDVESLILSIAQNESEILRLIALTGKSPLNPKKTRKGRVSATVAFSSLFPAKSSNCSDRSLCGNTHELDRPTNPERQPKKANSRRPAFISS